MQNTMQRTKTFLKIGIASIIAISLTSAIWGPKFLYAQSGTSTETADTTEPADVENLQAAAGDAEVQLSWNAASDNVAVTGYKIYRGTHSVATAEDQYDLPVIPVGNVQTYTVKNLTNGQLYYFSITAVDAAGNESVNYATEVSATPQSAASGAGDDSKPPQVKEVTAEDAITVLVVFSEPIKLPTEQPASAIVISKVLDQTRLIVQNAEIDARDATGTTVLLTTAPQEANADYIVTAGIEIEDLLGNPVVSGTSDTGSFKGSAIQKEAPEPEEIIIPPAGTTTIEIPPPPPPAPTDTEAPLLTAGSADFNNRISVTFSEKITLPENPLDKFTVVKKGTQDALRVVNVSLSVDAKTVFITTESQAPVEYEVKAAGVTDEAGNAISAEADSIIVTGKGSSLEDLVPPEDVTKLIAKIKGAEKNIVELRWEASENSGDDLADQLLYQSEDKKGTAFGDATSLGTTTTAIEVEDLKAGQWYTFKVSTKDTSENESKGTMTSIYLPETGPGILAAGLTSLLMGWYSRRRKKN